MCMVSNVHGWGHQDFGDKWPNYVPHYPDFAPKVAPWVPPPTTPNTLEAMKQWLEEFKKIIKAAEEFDRQTKQPDCEDTAKTAWMKEMEDRLKKLEAAPK